MKHINPISFIFVLGLLVVFSFSAFSAITTTFDYSDPADYILDTSNNQSIVGGKLVLGDQNEIQINDEVDSIQANPDVALMNNGNMFVVWLTGDTTTSGDDNSSFHVAGKIVDQKGRTVVEEFQVNQYPSGLQQPFSLVTLANDNIMVFMNTGDTTDSIDDSGTHISAIVFDENGDVVVDEFTVNELIDGAQSFADSILLGNGNVFVTWNSADASDPDDADGTHVAGKIIGPDGTTVVNEFVVNETTANNHLNPKVFSLVGDVLSENRVLVTWAQGAADYDLYAKIYNEDGTVARAEYVLAAGAGTQDKPELVKIGSDQYFIVYESGDTAVGVENDSDDIEGQVIDSAGVQLLAPFQINEEFGGAQFVPAVDVFSDGQLYVSWSSLDDDTLFDDDSGSYVAGRILEITDSGGLSTSFISDEFQVNVETDDNQRDVNSIVVDDVVFNYYVDYSALSTYGDDPDRKIALTYFNQDLTYFKSVFNPSSSLDSGIAMTESFREIDVVYGDENEGEAKLQISNDDGVNWYYFDGSEWVIATSTEGNSNTVEVLNSNLVTFFSQFGAGGTINAKLFLVSDGTESVVVDSLSFLENEIPVIGNGDAVVDVDVPENRESVANLVNNDPEEDTVEYSITGGADSELFSFDENYLKISLDGDLGETYEVVVTASDSFGGEVEQTFNVTIVRVAPSNGSSSSSSTSSPFEKNEESSLNDEAVENSLNSVAKTEDDTGEEPMLVEYDNFTNEVVVSPKGAFCKHNFMTRHSDLDEVTRLDAVKLLIDILCVDVTSSKFNKEFKDTSDLSTIDKMYINKAYEIRLINGYPDGTFRPNEGLNYAELSALLFRSLDNVSPESSPWFLEYVNKANIVSSERINEMVTKLNFVTKVEEFFEI